MYFPFDSGNNIQKERVWEEKKRGRNLTESETSAERNSSHTAKGIKSTWDPELKVLFTDPPI